MRQIEDGKIKKMSKKRKSKKIKIERPNSIYHLQQEGRGHADIKRRLKRSTHPNAAALTAGGRRVRSGVWSVECGVWRDGVTVL